MIRRAIIQWAVLMLLVTIAGCFPEDERVAPRERNEITIPYSLYTYQTYFNLENEMILSFHTFSDWDLGFESSDSGYHVILNSARFMMAGNTGNKDFGSVTTPDGTDLFLDASSGNTDSTAIGIWGDFSSPGGPVSYRDVYIIDRGSDENGDDFGLKKIQLGDFSQRDGYSLRFSNIDGSDDHTVTIQKDPSVRFVLFSFDNGGSVKVKEPPADQWDLCFTKYSTILYENDTIPTPYLVRGVYINPEHISVTREMEIPFDQITEGLVKDYPYSRAQDVIGYAWKNYEDGIYRVVENLTWIIRHDNGSLYKMRFTSFHNDQGERGYPSFELLKMN